MPLVFNMNYVLFSYCCFQFINDLEKDRQYWGWPSELQEVGERSYVVQWNLDITKCQGTGKMCSLYRGFVISRFFFICFTMTGVMKIVRYTEDFVI